MTDEEGATEGAYERLKSMLEGLPISCRNQIEQLVELLGSTKPDAREQVLESVKHLIEQDCDSQVALSQGLDRLVLTLTEAKNAGLNEQPDTGLCKVINLRRP